MKPINLFLLLFLQLSFGQKTIPDVIQQFNKNSVPYITVEELKGTDDVTLLDAREPEEFKVSHLDNAIYVGYKKFNAEKFLISFPNKNTPLVVYCSLGVRSENIGEKLLKLGYTNVRNLYGGIFEWKNKDNPVVNMNGEETEEVHAFSKMWGKYLLKGTKIYNKNKK
ncbi:rhodanese-like domain-containing protein [Flavobacterium sp. NRK F7]|uniref:rhodanese-like domain-containing protein n=1 Tax=Flavobacterium sp. NRK F7 TaxID=2954930 RepID=UPI002090B618|nr:rhodanese-like domain-containing protein [Flavobacterium sp. NRK F7]MCO6164456.1 rhodanese-like domain-containing protein [Flavobacterium sp. NRK F7]